MKRLLNNLFLLSFIFTILTSCNSSQKLVNQGRYDEAINKASRKLKRNKNKEKEVLALQKAYEKANLKDTEQINYLRQEGAPDNWDKIFNIYSRMSARQEKIKPLLPLTNAVFEIVNYDTEKISSKQKAAEYFYAHSITLLDTKEKKNARIAYEELSKAKSYNPNFKDIDDQIKKAQALGISYVLFKMENKTGTPLPPDFESELTKIALNELNDGWLVYETKENKNYKYDYTILVNMKQIDVTPESVKEYNYQETKTIPDGWDYFLDSHGNVKKDSLGNDIKKKNSKLFHVM